MTIRSPAVCGKFYPSERAKLEKAVRDSFIGELGPGTLPIGHRKEKVFGALVPHAGYIFSAQCSAWTYKEIAEAELPDIFIILGSNHTGRERKPFTLSLKDFETPMGIVKTNKQFIRKILEKNSDLCDHNESAHDSEHSIEVQLPFLQFVTEFKELEIVPIVVSKTSLKDYETFSDLIIEISKELGKKICIIASSDLTHYGPAYGFVPFSGSSDEELKKKLNDLDRGAIANIVKFDVLGLNHYLNRTKASICGVASVICMMLISKKLGSKTGELKCHYNSGEILKDYNNVVGYASIVFK